MNVCMYVNECMNVCIITDFNECMYVNVCIITDFNEYMYVNVCIITDFNARSIVQTEHCA